ncbi:hypothetical protein [Fictibacillus enclensis]|uniref:hypothetical protein n=1 Tax=Fictibacillus enclensis TaxID=1017270 RepID=UPI0024C09936|nr:hypothetical protein [Fictibacillus enclensis]WHY72379.1 hypothetical protein QNH15_25920 [Fictibacillus enclensis]
MEIHLKRKELWIFILSVFILGGEIGLIANVLFTEFYSENRLLFVAFLALLLLLTIFASIKLMLATNEKVFERDFIFTYDLSSNKFIDIPYNPSSVNARVLMDNLGVKNKERVKIERVFEKNIEFYNFSNNIVAQIILSRIIKHSRNKYTETVTLQKLKELLVNYRYIDVDSIVGEDITFRVKDGKEIKRPNLILPKGFKINCNDIRNINIKSYYGFVNFEWNTVATTDTKTSQLLSTFNDIDLSNCIEVQVKIRLKYGYSIFKLFKKDIVDFNEFIENCKDKMNTFSVEYSKQKYDNDYSVKILKYIENQFEDNFNKIKNIINKLLLINQLMP